MDGSKPEEKNNYETAKHKLTNKLTPALFVTLDEFYRRKLLPGEALSVFVHQKLLKKKKKKKKKLLLQAMPDLDTTTRDQLLLHQFVAGLPQAVSWQLRATGDLAATMERAQALNFTIYIYIYIYTVSFHSFFLHPPAVTLSLSGSLLCESSPTAITLTV